MFMENTQKFFREIDLFDFTSFFSSGLFKNFPWGGGRDWQQYILVYTHHIFFGATCPKGNKELRDTSSNAHYFNFPGFFKDSRSTPRVGISLMGSHRAGIESVMYSV